MLPTSPQRRGDPPEAAAQRRGGFMLLDIVLALAVTGMLALLVWPLIPRDTSSSRHAAYAMEIAALLKSDRTVATREVREVATDVDVGRRIISSGAGLGEIRLPRDVVLDVLASNVCSAGEGHFAIAFAPDGRACGAVLRVVKGGRDWKVRVNWLTGFIDVLAPGQS